MIYNLLMVGCCLWCVIFKVYGLIFSNGKQYRLKHGLDDRHCWSWRLRDNDDDNDNNIENDDDLNNKK